MQTTLRPVGESTLWDEFKLEDVLVGIQPGFARRPSNSGDVAHLRTNNISPEGKLDLSQLKHVKASKGEIEKYSLVKGDVLFNNTNSDIWVGKTAFVHQNLEALYSNHLTRLRVDKSRVDAQFLAIYLHKLQEEGFFKAISTRWVNQTAVNTTALRHLKLRIPPIEYQRAVVVLLNKVEVVKELREQANRLTSKIIQSVFLKMFGNIAEFPEHTMFDTCELVTDGTHDLPELATEGIPLISAKNVRDGVIDFEDVHYISKATDEILAKRCKPRRGDLLLVCVGHTIGRSALVLDDIDFNVFRSVALIRPNQIVLNPFFLYFLVRSNRFQEQIRAERHISGQPGLYIKSVKNLRVNIPPLDLQERFASIAQKSLAVRQVQMKAMQEINELLHSLMQKAFRGQLKTAAITTEA